MTNKTPLFNILPDKNHDDFLIDQYKLYVESTQKISDNRLSTVNFMLVFLSSLIVLINTLLDDKHIAIALCLIGILICFYSIFMVKQFEKLNNVKFKIINEIEQKLPVRLYCYEWELITEGRQKHFGFSKMEIGLFIILIFIFICILMKVVLT